MIFVPGEVRENFTWEDWSWPSGGTSRSRSLICCGRSKVGIANGQPTPQTCKEAEITVQTYYRWRKEYGGLKLDQAKRLKELVRENSKLKRLVAELSLEKQVLKDDQVEVFVPRRVRMHHSRGL